MVPCHKKWPKTSNWVKNCSGSAPGTLKTLSYLLCAVAWHSSTCQMKGLPLPASLTECLLPVQEPGHVRTIRQAPLGEVSPCSTVSFFGKQEKPSFLLYGLYLEVTCHNSNLHTTFPSQTKPPNKKKIPHLCFLFMAYLTLYCTLQKKRSPPTLPFREKVNSATKFL